MYSEMAAVWCCHTEQGWVPYPDADCANIDAAFNSNQLHFDVNLNRNSYRIDFAKCIQTNRKTSIPRPVQRISQDDVSILS